jgi:hypothetical protein
MKLQANKNKMMKVFKLWIEEDGLTTFETLHSTREKAYNAVNDLVEAISYEGMRLVLTQNESNLFTFYDKKAKLGIYAKEISID